MNDTYNAYLLSEAWMEKRTQRLNLSGWKCEACGGKQLLQVHHLTYERIFQESMEDLMVLCRIHHEAAEEMKKKGAIKCTGCVVRLRTDTLRLIAPLERYVQAPIGRKATVRGSEPKKPKRLKPSKAERRERMKEGVAASRVWSPEALKKIPAAYHHLTWMASKEEVLPILLSDQKFLELLKLPQRQYRLKYRKMFPKCPPRGRIASVAGQLWLDVQKGKYPHLVPLLPSQPSPPH